MRDAPKTIPYPNTPDLKKKSYSVGVAMYLFDPTHDVGHQPDSVSIKCTTCKAVTEHQFEVIKPTVVDEEVKPLELLKLAKRLTLCQTCGLLKLIN